MKADLRTDKLVAQKYQELEATCRLWIAATEAKDQRIQELTTECNRLRQRIARLGRRRDYGNCLISRQQIRHAK